MSKAEAKWFYAEYHGHRVEDLRRVLSKLQATETSDTRPVWYLAGDSSMDNKHWLYPSHISKESANALKGPHAAPGTNGYEHCLSPPIMVKDVAYWVNHFLAQETSTRAVCVNAAVEESTLADRQNGALLPQDEFIRDNITPDDTLIVSVGGNDIALRPTTATVFNMATLIYLSTHGMIESGWAIGMGHFIRLFKDRVQQYVEQMVSKTKPKAVVVNMIYYLDQRPGGSWADPVLQRLGYDQDPSKLQLLIRQMYLRATSQIKIEGVKVIPNPLFEALDGKDTGDYDNRVEPSVAGGEKIGRQFCELLVDDHSRAGVELPGRVSQSGDSAGVANSSL